MPVQDANNCLFDSVLFFYPHKPPQYNGSSLRLQLINDMASYPAQYKVNKNTKNIINHIVKSAEQFNIKIQTPALNKPYFIYIFTVCYPS